MSRDSSSDSESSCSSVSSYYEESDDYNVQDERDEHNVTDRPRHSLSTSSIVDDVDEGAYQDEPIASPEWVEDYSQKQKEKIHACT
ncbi:hypothetical protein AC249_AIPGENE28562 [Exaiptasia diaphana]|nr:hypothetical protein AC249_AIPGENE28562 [Exaiptasia diaphana]